MPFFSVTLNLCLTLEEITKRKQLTNGSRRRRRRCFASFARIIQCFCYRQKSGHAHLLFYLHTWLFGSVCLFAATAAARIPKYKHITRTHVCIATLDLSKHFTAVCLVVGEEEEFPSAAAGKTDAGRNSAPKEERRPPHPRALAFDFDCFHFNHVDE